MLYCRKKASVLAYDHETQTIAELEKTAYELKRRNSQTPACVKNDALPWANVLFCRFASELSGLTNTTELLIYLLKQAENLLLRQFSLPYGRKRGPFRRRERRKAGYPENIRENRRLSVFLSDGEGYTFQSTERRSFSGNDKNGKTLPRRNYFCR
ncbi:MAG: hypothetical protein ACLRSW_13130 [Christensenellaceae bacterium]